MVSHTQTSENTVWIKSSWRRRPESFQCVFFLSSYLSIFLSFKRIICVVFLLATGSIRLPFYPAGSQTKQMNHSCIHPFILPAHNSTQWLNDSLKGAGQTPLLMIFCASTRRWMTCVLPGHVELSGLGNRRNCLLFFSPSPMLHLSTKQSQHSYSFFMINDVLIFVVRCGIVDMKLYCFSIIPLTLRSRSMMADEEADCFADLQDIQFYCNRKKIVVVNNAGHLCVDAAWLRCNWYPCHGNWLKQIIRVPHKPIRSWSMILHNSTVRRDTSLLFTGMQFVCHLLCIVGHATIHAYTMLLIFKECLYVISTPPSWSSATHAFAW